MQRKFPEIRGVKMGWVRGDGPDGNDFLCLLFESQFLLDIHPSTILLWLTHIVQLELDCTSAHLSWHKSSFVDLILIGRNYPLTLLTPFWLPLRLNNFNLVNSQSIVLIPGCKSKSSWIFSALQSDLKHSFMSFKVLPKKCIIMVYGITNHSMKIL